ncbi:YpoC family protein [Anoxybacteroides amylolyticum]|uniref:YpoC family protein n=1 Tax=Anoxybacteroides amylolyticum TaxID=294699 RepID=UPI001EE7167A|nr:hypothetical protein [Anoxybacillus amylolyticus]
MPNEFVHPLFFRLGDNVPASDAPFPEAMKHVYFYYDIVGIPAPWEEIESIPAVFKLWYEERERLESCFAKRDRTSAREPMIRGISYFLVCLHWLNGKRVERVKEWEKEIATLAVKPVNAIERLQFIFARPDLYHSFIQLSELFSETEKLYYKTLVKRKKGMSPR